MQLVVLACVVAGVATAVVLLLVGGDDPRPAGKTAQARIADPGPVSAYLAAAGTDVQAVSTYDYRSIDGALNNGLQVTTGAYRRAYQLALSGTNAASAVRDRVVQSFELLAVGVGEVSDGGRQAKVLVFGIQRVESAVGRRASTITLTATMRRVGNRYLISKLVEDANAGLPPGTDGLRAAAEAGRQEIVNLLSFRRSDFAADQRRALDGAIGSLRGDIARRAASTKTGLEAGNYDLVGAATAVAVESARGESVVMLVAATGQRVNADGSRESVTDGRFEVSLTRVGERWLVERVTAFGSA